MAFFELMTKIGNMIYLSVLWILGCIPIVTIGASTTAYCSVLRKIRFNKEGYITKGYIQEFRANFKKSTQVWLVLMVAIVVLYLDSRVSSALVDTYGGMYVALVPMYYMLLFVVMSVVMWVFPYIARFENEPLKYIVNAFLIAMRHMGYTITIMLIDILILLSGTEIYLPVLLFAPLLIGIINISMMDVIFRKYIE